MLVVKSTSLRANPLAIDAVAHVAAGDNGEPRGVSEPLGSVRSSSWRGSSNRGSSSHNPPGDARLFDELQRELDRAGVRALVFGVRGQLELSAADDGPSESVRAATFEALEMFQKRAARLLHGAGMAHVDVTLANSGAVRWSSVSRDSSLVMVADDGNTSPALVERLSGRLRRSREAANASGDGVSRSLS